MPETEWESSVKRRSPLPIWAALALGLAAAAAVVYHNNRDFFSTLQFDRQQTKGEADAPAVPYVTTGETLTAAAPAGEPLSPEPDPSVKETPVLPKAEARGISPPAAVASSSRDTLPLPVRITGISSPVAGRKDLRIYCDLSLYFSDTAARRAVLIRRGELAAMVRAVMQEHGLKGLSADALEPELLPVLNAIFEAPVLTGLDITSLRVEKVLRK